MPHFATDPYATLQVAPNSSAQQVRRAWLQLSKQHHPDRYPSAAQKSQATTRLQAINAAYEQLSDPHQRRSYDRERALALRPHLATRQLARRPVATATQSFQNRQLPHRYTPGGKYVVFDGITYMCLAEAARRIRQPEARLRMYLENGELMAFEFDNQQWVTEASLLPLRIRHRPSVLDHPRATWKPVVPHFGARRSQRAPVAIGPRPEPTMGRQYDSPRIDAEASTLLAIAPTLCLLVIGMLLYGYLANMGSVWPQLQALPQMLGM